MYDIFHQIQCIRMNDRDIISVISNFKIAKQFPILVYSQPENFDNLKYAW